MTEKKLSRKEYKAKHTKDNYRRYNIYINYKEKDVIKKLESVDSKAGYIVKLVKDDIA